MQQFCGPSAKKGKSTDLRPGQCFHVVQTGAGTSARDSLHTLCMCHLPHTQQLKDMKICVFLSFLPSGFLKDEMNAQLYPFITAGVAVYKTLLTLTLTDTTTVDFLLPVSCFDVKHGAASVLVSPQKLGSNPAVLNRPVPGHMPTGLQGTPDLNSQLGSAPHTAAVMGSCPTGG